MLEFSGKDSIKISAYGWCFFENVNEHLARILNVAYEIEDTLVGKIVISVFLVCQTQSLKLPPI